MTRVEHPSILPWGTPVPGDIFRPSPGCINILLDVPEFRPCCTRMLATHRDIPVAGCTDDAICLTFAQSSGILMGVHNPNHDP